MATEITWVLISKDGIRQHLSPEMIFVGSQNCELTLKVSSSYSNFYEFLRFKVLSEINISKLICCLKYFLFIFCLLFDNLR